MRSGTDRDRKSGQVLVRTLGAKTQARRGRDMSSASDFRLQVQLLWLVNTAKTEEDGIVRLIARTISGYLATGGMSGVLKLDKTSKSIEG